MEEETTGYGRDIMTIVNTKANAQPITPEAQARKVVTISGRYALVREPDANKARWHELKVIKV